MTNEILNVNATTGEIEVSSLALIEPPTATLKAAQDAATQLQKIIAKKPHPVVFGGKRYLDFQDWQTLGTFYGVTAQVETVEPITLGQASGFHAVAVAMIRGRVISRAESWCMGDEANWKGKPVFQVASMAQTRACAKVLRNVLGWVAVLAGYEATPAEELDATITKSRQPVVPVKSEHRSDDDARVGQQVITEAQQKRLFAISKAKGWDAGQMQALLGRCGYTRSTEITRHDYDAIVQTVEAGPPVGSILDDPF